MRKSFTLFLILIVVCLLTCHACQQDDEDRWSAYEGKRTIEIYVYYLENGEWCEDEMTKVYVYYGFYNMDIADFDYAGNGVFVKGEEKIEPAGSFLVKDTRNCEPLLLPDDEKITIFLECDKLGGWTASESYSPGDAPIKLTWKIWG